MTEGINYVIELGGEAAGLIVKEGNRFRFYAAAKSYADLERNLYRSPAEAEDACRRIAWPGRATRPQTQQSQAMSAVKQFGDRYIRAGAQPFGRLAVS